ncbi:MAG: molybdopterin oxidoreductase family protein [Myxococcales bacterium]|nr:molybdopterin oxidoreductase family protein [Myxococcales bacterium]
MTRTAYTTCALCEAMCGLRVEVAGDRVVEIRGDEDDPFSRGHVCPKALALQDLHEDPDRLRRPMRRVGDTWEPLGWDEAIAFAADRIHDLQRRHGGDAFAAYLGNPTAHNLGAIVYAPLVLKSLRTKHRYSATSVDQLPHMFASFFVLGHQLLFAIPDLDRTDLFIAFGANPLASNGSIMTAGDVRGRLRAIRERGGRVVYFDPRRTESAKAADAHHFIRPGTDAFVLLAMLHVVFAEGLVKLGRLASSCERLDVLEAVTKAYTPERAERVSGVPAATTRALARELATTERALVYGRVGACVQEHGGLAAWALLALNLVTGHFDEPGGVMFPTPAVDVIRGGAGVGISRGSFGRWKSRVRGLPEFGGELPVACLAEEITTPGEGRVRGLLTICGNPVLSTPNGAQLERALAGLDFMVSVDPYLNETTRHAHLILPPVSPLERDHYDLVFHAVAVRNTAKWSPAVFPKPEGARDDGEILGALLEAIEHRRGRLTKRALRATALRRLGARRVVDLGLRVGPYGAGVAGVAVGERGLVRARGDLSVAALERAPHGVDLGPLERCMPDRLPRRDGRRVIDLAPQLLVDDLRRLDEYERRLDDASPALSLIGRRQLRSNNSWMHNAPQLMKGRDRCTLLMHPSDAEARGLASGDRVRVASRVGEVEAPLEVSDEVMPGVVSLPHGFGHHRPGVRLRVAAESPGVSLNDLTDDRALDLLTGTAVLNGTPVEVTRAPG